MEVLILIMKSQYAKIDSHKKKSDILVIHCSDPRFQNAYRSLIDELGKYYDLLVFPGASKAIVGNKSVLENIKLLHSLHRFGEIQILDHVQCGAFGEIDDELKAHAKKLDAASKLLKATIPGVKVKARLLGEKRELTVEPQG